MSEPRTHYQISLTARQAVGLFAGLLLAIGLAFFFGLMAGLSGRDRSGPERIADGAEAAKVPTAAPDSPPPVETGIPSGDTSAAAAQTPAPGEATPPATLRTFEDSADEEPAPAPNDSGSRTRIAGSAAQPPASAASPAKAPAASRPPASGGAGRIWVQAASLSSHDEASALGARLNRHGFHAVVLPGSGPKGKIYRVRVGPYPSEDEASRAVAKLSRQERIREPWIVPDGK